MAKLNKELSEKLGINVYESKIVPPGTAYMASNNWVQVNLDTSRRARASWKLKRLRSKLKTRWTSIFHTHGH